MYGNLSRRVIKPQYLRQLGRSVGRSMRGTSFRSAVGSGRRRAASVTRRKKVTVPTKKKSTELIEEADHHKLGQPCVQDENRDKSNTKRATIDEGSLSRTEKKEEVKINSTTETVEKKFYDKVDREGNNFEGKQEKGKKEKRTSKKSKKANLSGSEDEYEEWFDIIHHLADHGMKEMKHLQKHLARQEAKNTL